MTVGILGTGGMADALATRWARAGHRLAIGGRDAAKARRLAGKVGHGARPTGLREAAESSEVVLAALPYGAGAEVARELRDALAGRVLIDCANPVGPGFRLLTGQGPSAAEQLAAAAPGARVVKAFNLCHESVWRLNPPVFDGRPLAVPLCGDDPGALTVTAELVRALGCTPVTAGPLTHAHLLEATAALYITLWVGQNADVQALAPPLPHATG
ncbi:NADPH-dependent F420 reductase [Kitasatospora cheerisanensis]|uniref:NADPH-dependent F420 reductase n=1 Tax=Kitasatospora cheerisanensis TaxID=81942 RepID=UPI00055DB654|nr:NAD(P)-binding domain-containing protein [Kitasatospora cheerisanensis]